uniref:Uncharacterized protein n=1 Tax=Salix viminalis TaxID=40686 RepID=A0A6N2LLH6_SALVM
MSDDKEEDRFIKESGATNDISTLLRRSSLLDFEQACQKKLALDLDSSLQRDQVKPIWREERIPTELDLQRLRDLGRAFEDDAGEEGAVGMEGAIKQAASKVKLSYNPCFQFTSDPIPQAAICALFPRLCLGMLAIP